ncbi:Phosphoesterase, DHH family protein [Lactococcus chungangensis CAU 28 = DSM 22330]|uniref:Cyclic-di-AMP phosphodiesterase n=1 Tax=Pseudolactococcus chungangensis CAU 28 = DSM 22330 TaxID=1122154 RepID=A0A1K2HE20_9LACT|nr:DHH family phosphoesterase [Lactococcus chungangensis]PCS03595.1 Phosphoesterase, DHH family protein [Lactococcus chungangensis CAU 28 = DSM 22330]SFZ75052.1 c-di-AMP phosphodiesterase, consists of a GGDEF-like and DHH domains [Lactococcus chungangensis CAU 28 = DSM 22330]
MKRYERFLPLIIIISMTVVYLCEVIILRLAEFQQTELVLLLVVNLIVMFLLLARARVVMANNLDNIRELNETAENSLNATLDTMPIGVLRYSEFDYTPEWFNPYVDIIFSNDEDKLEADKIKEIVQDIDDQGMQYLSVGQKKYAIKVDHKKKLLYFIDATSEVVAKTITRESRPVIGIISVDNYDDTTDLISDSSRTIINNFIATKIDAFSNKYNVYISRYNASRYYIYTNYLTLKQIMDDKFKFVNAFREEATEKNFSLTLSIGMSYGLENFSKIGKTALDNLELALVRGGDQVVIKENINTAKPIYFGGNSASHTQKSRTRARAIATALRTIVLESENVFVMGHKYPDMDALGAAVATKIFANMNDKEAFIVYDEKQLLPDVERAIAKLNESKDGFAHIIRMDTAYELKKSNSLLIMVDHSKTSQTMDYDFYKSFDKVVVIDHHRRDDDFPKNALLTYIESGASSASELVVEVLQYQNDQKQKMSKVEASIALAGISVDTQKFSKGTTARTFEAASFLRSQGADNNLIKKFLATEFDKYKKINEIVLNAEFHDNIAIGIGLYRKMYDNVTIAKAADTLLNMVGIDASFTIVNHENGYVAISARSSGDFNVQRIMEKFGGGGHFNNAAAQIYEKTPTEVRDDLLKLLNRSGDDK